MDLESMAEVSLNDLIEAGVHFGHQTRRWNPKMRPFIFTERNGIHIIDLRKTLDRLETARDAVRKVVLKGERVLFVCTKRQLRGIVEEQAERCGSMYVTERWLGGMLTNFQTIRQQIRRLKELERGFEENAYEFYTKKERLLIDRERLKLDKYFSGVKDMGRLPGAVFVVDAHREAIAVREANRLGIPVIAITDTNANPDSIDFPIPGNDDAIRSVSLIASAMAEAVMAARREAPEGQREAAVDAEATTYSTETGEKVVAGAARKDKPRPKKRRVKRVPLPEVIAARRKSSGEGGDDAEEEAGAQADGEEVEATAAPEAVEAETVADEAVADETVADETVAAAVEEVSAEQDDDAPSEEAAPEEPGDAAVEEESEEAKEG